MSETKTYRCWANMLARCRNKNHPNYKRYGGRGIDVDITWSKFENFLADMGECPPGLTIERRDNNKGYSKNNCFWAGTRDQGRNKRWPNGKEAPHNVQDIKDGWASLRDAIETLEPGRTIEFECPQEEVRRFRSMALTHGRRYHKGEWGLRTTVRAGLLICYLHPTGFPGD